LKFEKFLFKPIEFVLHPLWGGFAPRWSTWSNQQGIGHVQFGKLKVTSRLTRPSIWAPVPFSVG